MESNPGEEWRDVVGYEGLYNVSNQGRLFSVRFGRVMSLVRNRYGHQCAALCKCGRRRQRFIHRLVLEAFVGPCPPGMECRHMNGVSDDNRAENLKWGTPKENVADQITHGVIARGQCNGNSRLTESDVLEILRAQGSHSRIAQTYGVNPSTISKIKRGDMWRHLQGANNAS